MHLQASAALLAVSFSASAQAVTLFEGLAAANAAKFAQFIQADPVLVGIFTAPDVHTVFAPSDDSFGSINQTIFRRSLYLAARQSTDRSANQQCSNDRTKIAQTKAPGGAVVDSNLLGDGGGPTPIVGRSNTPNSGNGTTKRQSIEERVSLFTGLGDNVTVVQEDTEYDGGWIQTTNGLFTRPRSPFTSMKDKGLESLASALTAANMTLVVTAPLPKGVTVFAPSEAAIAAAGGPANVNLEDHIVPNFLGVTPNLKDGLVLTSQSGTRLTVHVRGGEIFIDNAKIVVNDIITSNGAIQILDKVIEVPVQFTGAATAEKTISIATAALGLLVSIGFATFIQ